MATYQCPKCFNTLLRSNKILHDLKCTKESPVELSQENPYTSGAYNVDSGLRYSTNDYSSDLRISTNLNLDSELRKSAGNRYYKRMSFMNDDGTTTEIKKDTDMSGKEELLEITYDPQGNIIGRKRADGGSSSVRFKFHELQEYNAYDPMDNYNIYEGGSVYVQTIPVDITYVPVSESYSTDYNTYNNTYEHDFGNRGYSLMQNNINNVKVVKLNQNTTSNTNYINNASSNDNNEDLNKYFVNYQNNSYTNQNDVYSNNNYNYNNNINYNTDNYNYIQNTSMNNLGNVNNSVNQNNQNIDVMLSNCAKVTKLTGNNF